MFAVGVCCVVAVVAVGRGEELKVVLKGSVAGVFGDGLVEEAPVPLVTWVLEEEFGYNVSQT